MTRKVNKKINCANIALLIIDVQNDFCLDRNGSLGVPNTDNCRYLNNIKKLIDMFHSSRIILTQDYHPEKNSIDKEVTQELPSHQYMQKINNVVLYTNDHISFARRHKASPYTTQQIPYQVSIDDDIKYINQEMWPAHCVINSKGAEFHPILINHFKPVFGVLVKSDNINQIANAPEYKIIRKGYHVDIDSYSGFGSKPIEQPNNNTIIIEDETLLHPLLQAMKVDTIYVCGLALDFCVKYTCFDGVKKGYKTYCVTDATEPVLPNIKKEDRTSGKQKVLETLQSNGVHLLNTHEACKTLDLLNTTNKKHITIIETTKKNTCVIT